MDRMGHEERRSVRPGPPWHITRSWYSERPNWSRTPVPRMGRSARLLRRRLSPLQLRAQHLEVVALRLDQADRAGAAGDGHDVAAAQREPALAVEGEMGVALAPGPQPHLDRRTVAHDQRPVGEHVRA